MLFPPNKVLNSSTSENSETNLLFYSDKTISLETNSISHNGQHELPTQRTNSQYSQDFHDPPLFALPGQLPSTICRMDSSTPCLNDEPGAFVLHDILDTPDQFASHTSLSTADSDILSHLLDPEFYPVFPDESHSSFLTSLTSPEANFPLFPNYNANWPWFDQNSDLTTPTTTFDSSALLDFCSPSNTLFDVQASPSLSLAASLFKSDVFDESPHQINPYPTPDSHLLDSFLSSLNNPIMFSALLSPMTTPALSTLPASSSDVFANPFRIPSTDCDSFELFPSLDEEVPLNSPSQSPACDPAFLSSLSDILKLHQDALASGNLTQDHIASLVKTLTGIAQPLPSETSPSISSSAFPNACLPISSASLTSEPNDVSTAGPIRRVPVRKRRVSKMYPCDHPGCDKAFTRHFNLMAHQKTHDPNRERPYRCELCLKSFIRAHDLIRHQPVHTKVKEFECDLCLKRFTRKDAKDRHIMLGKCK